MKNISLIMILFLSSFVFCCQKGEQGEVGPVGATGTKGANGDKGEIGISDSKGMKISAWSTVKAVDWVSLNTTSFNVGFTLPSLTSEVVKKGNVFFFMQPVGTNIVYPLPYSQSTGTKFYGRLINDSNGPSIDIIYSIIPFLGGAKLTTDYKFRLVIVPAGARISAKVDWQNYESVKKYLNLND